MKLPCPVVRDLLPLYAEDMVESETRALIDNHLADCSECQQKLSEAKIGAVVPVDAAKPLLALKRQIRRRRWIAAIIAGLLVFVCVFTYDYRANSLKPIPWQDGLVEVLGVETRSYEDVYGGDPPEGRASTVEALVLKVDGRINGTQETYYAEDDGTNTAILQGFGRRADFAQNGLTPSNEMVICPVPDRLIYGYEAPQCILWGEPLNGGVEVLPRLALAYYVLFALVLTALAGLLWLLFRKRAWSWILRQVTFAPLSYAIAHLLLMGTSTTSFSLTRDFCSTALVAVALYALFSLSWHAWLQHKE